MIFTWPPMWKTDRIAPDMKTIVCDSPEMGDCYTRLINLMPGVLADMEPWIREQLKTVPGADPKVVLQIVESSGGEGVRIGNHAKYTELVNVLNPAMDDLMAGKVAGGPMLQAVKPQLQAILDGR